MKPQPRIAITDPRFQYRDSSHTDLAKTFREARKRMAAEAEAEAMTAAQVAEEQAAKVAPIRKAVK